MKLVIALLVSFAGVAAADPVALDYRAAGGDCIDAGRFADEVSAKLGFVPWRAEAAATVRVRVERDGNHFTGTLRNTDGTAKIVDGATCAEVTANLVITAAVALDHSAAPVSPPAPPPPAPVAAAPAPANTDDVPVRFVSEAGGQTAFSMRAATGFGVASDGTQIASVLLSDLCTGPCAARVPRGDHFIVALDDEFLGARGGEQFHFDGPTTITAVPHSHRVARLTCLAIGVALAAVGAYALSSAFDTSADVANGGQGINTTNLTLGSLGLAIGSTLMLAPLWIHDSFTFRSSPGM